MNAPGAAHSLWLGASAVPIWCWKPGRFLENLWSSDHVSRLREWVLMVEKHGTSCSRRATISKGVQHAKLLFPQTSSYLGSSPLNQPFLETFWQIQRCVSWIVPNPIKLTTLSDPLSQPFSHIASLSHLTRTSHGFCAKVFVDHRPGCKLLLMSLVVDTPTECLPAANLEFCKQSRTKTSGLSISKDSLLLAPPIAERIIKWYEAHVALPKSSDLESPLIPLKAIIQRTRCPKQTDWHEAGASDLNSKRFSLG